MNNKILSIIMYVLTSISIVFFTIMIVNNNFIDVTGRIDVTWIVVLIVISCIFFFLGSLFYSKYKMDNKILNSSLYIYTIIYLVIVFFFTNMSRGNRIFNLYNISYNLIPFKYIIAKIQLAIETGIYADLVMIIGNFLILIPLAYFYPRTIKITKKFSKFCLLILLTTLMIETGQFAFGGGVFDIDDIILNSLGPILCFRLFNNSYISKFLDNVILQKKNKLSKSQTLLSVITIFCICLLFVLCIYLYWYHDSAVSATIINQSDFCEPAKIKAYEDENYIYYYNCRNYENIYIIYEKKFFSINIKSKYKIKDLLEGTKKYKSFSISDLEWSEYFVIESKYPKFIFTYYGDVYIDVTIKNKEIVEMVDPATEGIFDSTTASGYLKPLKPGETDLIVSIKDHMSREEIEKIIYVVDVDENLVVNYNVKETNRKILKLEHKINDTSENKTKSIKVNLSVSNLNETSPQSYFDEYHELDSLVDYIKDKFEITLDHKWLYNVHYYNDEQKDGYINFTYYISDKIITNKYIMFGIENGKVTTVYYNNLDLTVKEEKVKKLAYDFYNNSIPTRPTISEDSKIEKEDYRFQYDYKSKNTKYIYEVNIKSKYSYIISTEYLIK